MAGGFPATSRDLRQDFRPVSRLVLRRLHVPGSERPAVRTRAPPDAREQLSQAELGRVDRESRRLAAKLDGWSAAAVSRLAARRVVEEVERVRLRNVARNWYRGRRR